MFQDFKPEIKTFLIVVLVAVIISVGGILLLKTAQIPQPSPTPNETANWKTYTYKNASFQYPSDWVVVFDSTVAGQANGFSLHVEHEDAKGYQPDGLYISTYNDRASLTSENGYKLSVDRKFSETATGDNYIHFEVNSIPVYAGCAFYSKGYDTVAICDQILGTFRFVK